VEAGAEVAREGWRCHARISGSRGKEERGGAGAQWSVGERGGAGPGRACAVLFTYVLYLPLVVARAGVR
jgi:hypothetical protein